MHCIISAIRLLLGHYLVILFYRHFKWCNGVFRHKLTDAGLNQEVDTSAHLWQEMHPFHRCKWPSHPSLTWIFFVRFTTLKGEYVPIFTHSDNMTKMSITLANPSPVQIPLLRNPSPYTLLKVFSLSTLIPKGVSWWGDTTGMLAYCQPPSHSDSIPNPLPPFPCLLVHMQRKEASQLWQQQNTELQKRCTPLTVTIKQGVDRIRAGDDDLRGRDVQKEARSKEKGLSFLTLPFFHTFSFFFPRFIKPHLTYVWLGWR